MTMMTSSSLLLSLFSYTVKLSLFCIYSHHGFTPGEHSALQIIVKMRGDAWNDPPAVCRVTPEEVPVVALKDSGAVVRVLVGECSGSVSPAKVSGLPNIAILHVIAPPAAAAKPVSLPIDGQYERGWMYARSGTARVNQHDSADATLFIYVLTCGWQFFFSSSSCNMA